MREFCFHGSQYPTGEGVDETEQLKCSGNDVQKDRQGLLSDLSVGGNDEEEADDGGGSGSGVDGEQTVGINCYNTRPPSS